MNIATIIMAIIAGVLLVIAYLQGTSLPISGLKTGGKMLWDVFPLLLAAFVIAGLVQVLIPKNFIIRWVGKGSGLKGIMIGSIAGGLTPGGPYVSFPIIASLYKAGAGIGPVVAYITGWSLWAAGRVLFEISLVGPKVTLIRFISTLIFPPIAGIIAQVFFSRVASS